ncbi:MAG: hypothetical protein ABI855_04420 [Bacteroidota bacterium]
MPNDVIQNHFAAADELAFDAAMNTIETLLMARLRNLSEDENNQYGVIDEKNKGLVNKVKDYNDSQPALSTPDVNWVEYNDDYFDRRFLETRSNRLNALAKMMTETRRLHDYDNYQAALIDYAHTQYKNRLSPGSGYDTKEAELKQFFPAAH